MDVKSRSKRDSDIWDQLSSFDSTPYPVGARSSLATITSLSRYSFSPDPREWGSALSPDLIESDDEQYTPLRGQIKHRTRSSKISWRGLGNTGCLTLLISGLLLLFIGYPVITFYVPDENAPELRNNVNSTGQVPQMTGNFGLIDNDTPKSAYSRPSWNSGQPDLQLVFSDEFNAPGRTFYPGEDPYWEAVDLHYWATGNMEWYDPAAITTKNGALVIKLSQKETHGLDLEGGMLTTWNKFCFTGGYIEANVQLPGANNVLGFWPAIWTMGNLGRAGYGASLEGVWPYTYDSCDIGTVANQTINGAPQAATTGGDKSKGGVLSYLPGQRLSRCTCPGETHPGPRHSDGTFVGRSAPEIDIFEAQTDRKTLIPEVSQSAQWAPFNAGYLWLDTPDNLIIFNTSVSAFNTFIGSATQQATSVTSATNTSCYELNGGCFSAYGFEVIFTESNTLVSSEAPYSYPGFDDGYITWVSNGQAAWTLRGPGMGPDPSVQIQARPVPGEPMYIIANLGISTNFGPVDMDHLTFPAHMLIDYIRVYQPKNAINIGCSPKNYPTEPYINQHIEAYTNPNLTTWINDYHQPWPKNSFLGQC